MPRPVTLLALATILTLQAAPLPGQSDERIQWHSKYEDVIQKARESGKPILLEFRCGP